MVCPSRQPGTHPNTATHTCAHMFDAGTVAPPQGWVPLPGGCHPCIPVRVCPSPPTFAHLAHPSHPARPHTRGLHHGCVKPCAGLIQVECLHSPPSTPRLPASHPGPKHACDRRLCLEPSDCRSSLVQLYIGPHGTHIYPFSGNETHRVRLCFPGGTHNSTVPTPMF